MTVALRVDGVVQVLGSVRITTQSSVIAEQIYELVGYIVDICPVGTITDVEVTGTMPEIQITLNGRL